MPLPEEAPAGSEPWRWKKGHRPSNRLASRSPPQRAGWRSCPVPVECLPRLWTGRAGCLRGRRRARKERWKRSWGRPRREAVGVTFAEGLLPPRVSNQPPPARPGRADRPGRQSIPADLVCGPGGRLCADPWAARVGSRELSCAGSPSTSHVPGRSRPAVPPRRRVEPEPATARWTGEPAISQDPANAGKDLMAGFGPLALVADVAGKRRRLAGEHLVARHVLEALPVAGLEQDRQHNQLFALGPRQDARQLHPVYEVGGEERLADQQQRHLRPVNGSQDLLPRSRRPPAALFRRSGRTIASRRRGAGRSPRYGIKAN